jgi:hypothetical protein
MEAQILPFPIARRWAFVFKQAEHAALMHPDAGERYVLRQLKLQADTLRRKGVAEDLIQRELGCLETAIRAALWKAVNTPGGAA